MRRPHVRYDAPMKDITRRLAVSLLLVTLAACTKENGKPAPAPDGNEAKPLADVTAAPEGPDAIDAPPDDANRSETGLRWIVLKEGSGRLRPKPWDNARMHVRMRLPSGQEIMSSSSEYPDGVDLPLNDRMIPGWREAVTLMVAGERRRYWVPGELAYGEAEEGIEPSVDRPRGTLVLDVELLDVTPNENLPAIPENLTEPPKRATKTKSGLRFVVLEKGSGKKRPKEGSSVLVLYSGWTSDGTLISTTDFLGQPARMNFGDGIPGWQETLRMMVVGERRRVWVPEALAYDGQPGRPRGDLVYDIELVSVDP